MWWQGVKRKKVVSMVVVFIRVRREIILPEVVGEHDGFPPETQVVFDASSVVFAYIQNTAM